MHSCPLRSTLALAALLVGGFIPFLSASVPERMEVVDVRERFLQPATSTAPAQEVPRIERVVSVRYDVGYATYTFARFQSSDPTQAAADLAPDTLQRRAIDGTVPAGGFRSFVHQEVRYVGSPTPGRHQLVSPDGTTLAIDLPARTDFPSLPEFEVSTTLVTESGDLQLGFAPFRDAPAGSFIQVAVWGDAGLDSLVYRSPGYGEPGALPASSTRCLITGLNPKRSYRVSVTYLTAIQVDENTVTRTVYLRGARSWAVVATPAQGDNLYIAPQWPTDERLSRGSLHEVNFFAGSDVPVDTALYPRGSYFSYPSGTYILLQNGRELARTSRPPFTLSTSELPAIAEYQVVVQTPNETRSTRAFTLEVIDRDEAIRIVRQPSPDEAAARARGAALVLRTDAVGPNGERYQVETFAGVSPFHVRWYKDGIATGFEGPYRIFSQVTTSDEGLWHAVIHCGGQSIQTEPFRVSLGATTTVPTLSLTNVSALVHSGGDAGVPIVGAATRGDSTLLIRHIGPSLRSFGVENPLADPSLRIFVGEQSTASNQDWGSGDVGTLAAAMKSAGAFALPSQSTDAALVLEAPAGLVTAHMTSATTDKGTSLVELYSLAGAPVRNFSVRGRLEGAAREATVGFTLSGAGTRTYLVRAMGPGLRQFGLSSRLDPQLSLLVGRHTYEENQAWDIDTDPAAIAAATKRVGAVPFDHGTGESALLVSLSAGAYTVLLDRQGEGVGHYLIELWELP